MGDICFKNAIFETDAIFSNSKFYSPINFDHTSFKGLAILDSCEFKENVVFLYTNIYETLSLRSTTFRRSLNLAYINLRNASKIESHDIKLAWKSIPSASIGYDLSKNENMWKELPKHKDIQETYRLLKLEAISKKDNILAIQFNQKEYEKHYLKLWWFKNIGNKFILFFDKNISNFGTSVLRVLLWFLAINLTLYLKYYYVFLYLLCIIVFCEILGLFIQICGYILRMKLDSFVSKFILNFIIEYRYLYFFYAILAVLVYKDMTIKPEPQYGFFESIYHLTISAINNVVSFFKHLSNFFVDNDKWQDQLNGFIQSFLPFTDIKDSISELLLQGCVNISLLYQVIKSFRKYSKKL
ncbi:pentapeptide repeat-containing protein [Francisella uliginis]|uniref:Pentapeptide repeat-containing protein n=1 Tax=Francisella uliginis TaxID=573570 RepID=A0A1L4BSF3_9GAMM|nr:hypothetical protein F7310_05135 [Francisella uliginis]